MTVRATARGPERTSLHGDRADVLICGASFAGLAVARELAGSGADVLIVDRYEVGERATSACAAPTPWLHAMGVGEAISQELPYMTFTTAHGTVRYRLPWSWSSFDYRELCRALFAQTGARFETAKVDGRSGRTVHSDRGDLTADVIVDALGWRRVLAADGFQPPDAPLSRGLEVHPEASGGDALDVWVRRDLVRWGYGWRVPAGHESRVGVGSYEPRDHVKDPTKRLADELGYFAGCAERPARGGKGAQPSYRYQGNWFPHRLREATGDGVFFVGDSAGHCFPLSGEGIRTALYFGIAAGREIRAVIEHRQSAEAALERYGAFSRAHAPAFRRALVLQRLIPALPPRALMLVLRILDRQWLVDRAFGWYLDLAPPAFASPTRVSAR